jgi:hypothetical protein
MGVEHSPQVGPHFVNSRVEGILRGRFVGTNDGTIRFHTNDIIAGQSALVDTGRGDPHITVIIHDGKVAAGSGGQTLIVDALHEHNELVSGMNVIDIHKSPP